MSFALVPETCPAIEAALDVAFKAPSMDGALVAEILAKHGVTLDKRLSWALEEIVGRTLFDRKIALADGVLYRGTFPLRAALVREVERSNGMAPGRNRFQEWVDAYNSRKQPAPATKEVEK